MRSRSGVRPTARGIAIYADAGSPVVAVSDVAGDQDRRAPSGSATTSRSRTPTATPTRTGSWPRSPSSTRRRSRRRSTRPRSSGCSRCPSRTPSRRRPPRTPTGPPRARRQEDAPRPAAEEAAPRDRDHAAAEPPVKERLFAHPTRSNAVAAGGAQQEFLRTGRIDGALTPARALGLARDQIVIKKLKVGSQVPAGTVLGRIGGASSAKKPYVRFEIRPAGRGAPRDRPEADPRRLEAARVDGDLPRQGQEPVRRPRRRDADDRPDPADEQGDAAAARAQRPADPDLRVRPPGHPGGRDRPPRAGHARVPRRLRLQPDGDVARVRPLLPDGVGQRLRAHRPARRSTSPRSTASRSSATRARARSPTS